MFRPVLRGGVHLHDLLRPGGLEDTEGMAADMEDMEDTQNTEDAEDMEDTEDMEVTEDKKEVTLIIL